MLNVERILFPTDFTTHAERAFAYAAYMAVRFEAEVYVLNVQSLQAAQSPQNPMEYLPLEQREKVEHLYFAADAQDDVPVHYEQVQHASPVRAILEHAATTGADLIVMGTRGRGVSNSVTESSVTEEVVRLAGCPTLTIRTGERPVPPKVVRRVLAPVDLSDHARNQVAHAAALAEVYGAELDLLHVVEESTLGVIYGPGLGEVQQAEMRDRSEQALRRLVEEVGVTAAGFHVASGHPAAAINDFAAEHEARLIVMATHGRTGMERYLIGSVTEKVVRTAAWPVFSVRTFGKSLLNLEATSASQG